MLKAPPRVRTHLIEERHGAVLPALLHLELDDEGLGPNGAVRDGELHGLGWEGEIGGENRQEQTVRMNEIKVGSYSGPGIWENYLRQLQWGWLREKRTSKAASVLHQSLPTHHAY